MPDYRWRWNGYRHPALAVAYSPFVLNGANVLDLTRSGKDATVVGVRTAVNPLIAPKTTKAVSNTNIAGIQITAPTLGVLPVFSIVTWVKPTGGCGIYRNTVGTDLYAYVDLSGKVQARVSAGPDLSSREVVTGRTSMIAQTYDGATHKLFLNAKPSAQQAKAVGAITMSQLEFERTTGAYYLNGTMDNYMVYSVALTPDQINSIYRSANPRM